MTARSLQALDLAGASAGAVAVDRLRLRWPAWLLPLVAPLVLLALWQLATVRGWVPEQILPSPALVLNTLIELTENGDITTNLAVSLRRIAVGFGIGASLGLAFGALLGLSSGFAAYWGPLFRMIAQVPSLGWLPILMLVFGLDETLKYVLIAKASFVPVAMATDAGLRNIPTTYVEVGQAFRLRRTTLLWRLWLPATVPTLFSGIRLGLSHAWISLVVVEMLAATEGVGYMMVWGRTLFQMDIVIVGMILIGGIGLALDGGLRRLDGRLRRWSEPRG